MYIPFLISDVPFATVLMHFGVVSSVGGIILVLVFDVYNADLQFTGSFPTTLYECLILVSIGFLSFMGQLTLTVGMQIEAAGLITLMRKAFALIFAYTFQVTLFKVMWATGH